MATADLVLYDQLVNPRLLDLAPPQAVRIFAGKKSGNHSLEQGEIHAILIEEAAKGRRVVRLKGGDPFVFGRGGEEAEALQQAGIPFEVVPGITSAIAAPAYAGIPVTHRDFADSVTFVTGHGASPHLDLNRESRSTLVFLMGVTNLPNIIRDLIRQGISPKTPCAVIEWGTLPYQKVAEGTLETIVQEAKRAGVKPPAVTVVGRVVSLRKKLSWFEGKPLFGKRVLVTRTAEQARGFMTRLEQEGAEVIHIPLLEFRPPADWKPLDRAIRSVDRYEGLIFTSANAVRFFFDRVFQLKRDLRDQKGIDFYAIGPATRQALEQRGIRSNQASEYHSDGLIRFLERRVKGKRFLLPQVAGAPKVLIEGLRKKGGKIESVIAYRNIRPRKGMKILKGLLEANRLDLITFASSSAVDHFTTSLSRKLLQKARKIPVACLGPVTAKSARARGFPVRIEPKSSTIDQWVGAIISYFSPSPSDRSRSRT